MQTEKVVHPEEKKYVTHAHPTKRSVVATSIIQPARISRHPHRKQKPGARGCRVSGSKSAEEQCNTILHGNYTFQRYAMLDQGRGGLEFRGSAAGEGVVFFERVGFF